ncbi:hypothetical protein [Pseudobutyrivibrio xylanivorans]|uniref:Uncharacterized protein n=1 Tax=Pseudobutyrivibrio xylanivorans TaxID=185007 RepID=A0A1G5RPY6_PSEXY|nr:hypothetical protein [Pseudobutyrivibrio xylanivorans]SCZ76067.1 hypothetical protein SAMN02910350_00061 [Pseudobutyrivibrio xylanivorans]
MLALMTSEEAYECYGDYRENQGVELLSDVIKRLNAGETEETLIARGISEDIVNKALEVLKSIK